MTLQADRPIMLITATPGGGKTALAVKIMKEAVDAGRPLYVMGIPDLKLPHLTCPQIPDWTQNRQDPDNPALSLPFFTFPENSLIVLDEAQRVFRLRAAASKVPDHVAAFETVRHTGVTFLLITQHPNFIDTHIRNLVGQHVHLRDLGILGRHYYEWPECADPKTFQTAPIKKPWKLPKESFPLYKSASVHIKRNYTMPPALKLMAICLVAALGIGGYFYKSRIQPAMEKTSASPVTAADPLAAQQARHEVGQSSPSTPSVDPTEMLFAFDPRVPGRPETAPAYDSLRQVKNMPVVVGCFQTSNRCTCVNQQGLDAGLDDLQCRNWMTRTPFDAYREQTQADSAHARGVPVTDGNAKPETAPAQTQASPPAPNGNPSTI